MFIPVICIPPIESTSIRLNRISNKEKILGHSMYDENNVQLKLWLALVYGFKEKGMFILH